MDATDLKRIARAIAKRERRAKKRLDALSQGSKPFRQADPLLDAAFEAGTVTDDDIARFESEGAPVLTGDDE